LRSETVDKVYVINGPNLNMLGRREPEIYGTLTLKEIILNLKKYAASRGVRISSYQSNHEGDLIDKLQALSGRALSGKALSKKAHSHETRSRKAVAGRGWRGLIINPGAFTHYSYALRDAIKACGLRTVEVHLSDIEKREDFRKVSVIKDVCIAQIKGMGPQGYQKALDLLLDT
jgi:3-dehydroquinate dehydratase-2